MFSGTSMTAVGFSSGATAIGVIGVLFLIAGIVMIPCGFYYCSVVRQRMFAERQRVAQNVNAPLPSSGQGQVPVPVSAPRVELAASAYSSPYGQTSGYPTGLMVSSAPVLEPTVPATEWKGVTIGDDNTASAPPPPSYEMATQDVY